MKYHMSKMSENKQEKILKALSNYYSSIDWPKNALSSETKKFKLETTFSQYLGQNHYRKPNFENFYTFFDLAQAVQSFST